MSGETVGGDQGFDDEDDDDISGKPGGTGPNRPKVETSGTSLWMMMT